MMTAELIIRAAGISCPPPRHRRLFHSNPFMAMAIREHDIQRNENRNNKYRESCHFANVLCVVRKKEAAKQSGT
jgi:hypothetical protein